MGRPKSLIERKNINTTIEIELLEVLKKLSLEIGVPLNRLIEDAIKEKYLKKDRGEGR